MSLIEDLRRDLERGGGFGGESFGIVWTHISFRFRVLLRVRMLFYIKHEIIGDYVQQIAEGVNVRYVARRWTGHFEGMVKYFVNNIYFAFTYFLLELFMMVVKWNAFLVLPSDVVHSIDSQSSFSFVYSASHIVIFASVFFVLFFVIILTTTTQRSFCTFAKFSLLIYCKYFL